MMMMMKELEVLMETSLDFVVYRMNSGTFRTDQMFGGADGS